MGKYVLKRFLLLIPTLFIVLSIVFLLLRFAKGSPARELLIEENPEITPSPEEVYAKEVEMGLHDPILTQLVRFYALQRSSRW